MFFAKNDNGFKGPLMVASPAQCLVPGTAETPGLDHSDPLNDDSFFGSKRQIQNQSSGSSFLIFPTSQLWL